MSEVMPPPRRIGVFMGTRPEGVKLAPVISALSADESCSPVVISTGQHREMLDQVVEVFGIDIHHDLGLMRSNQTLASLSSRVLEGIDALLDVLDLELAIVQGDTTSVAMTALACFYRNVPVAHVEAGLRTGSVAFPFPEEANRRLVAPLATLHFAPTATARANLLSEGVSAASVLVTGNTVIDALLLEVMRQDEGEVARAIDLHLRSVLPDDWATVPFVLITGHRRENFGRGFNAVCSAIRALAAEFPEHRFIYPVHMNPLVSGPVHEQLGALPNVFLIAPQPYRAFVALMRRSRVVLTDSGGVQEEAPALGKPVLVMRDSTERPEGVAAGTVRLVGTDPHRIHDEVSWLLSDSTRYDAMARARNPYGDGYAALRIASGVRRALGLPQLPLPEGVLLEWEG